MTFKDESGVMLVVSKNFETIESVKIIEIAKVKNEQAYHVETESALVVVVSGDYRKNQGGSLVVNGKILKRYSWLSTPTSWYAYTKGNEFLKFANTTKLSTVQRKAIEMDCSFVETITKKRL